MALYSPEKARRSIFNTIGFRAISQIATFAGYVVLVRGLSEHAFGIYSLLYAFIPVISTAASLGLEQTLRRYQPEYLRTGETAAAAWLMRVVMIARLLSNVAILAVVLLAWNLIAPVFHLSGYRPDFAFFCLAILLYFQGRMLEFGMASHMMHQYAVGSTVLFAVAKLAAYVGLAAAHALTLRSAIFADTLGYALAYVLLRAAYYYKVASSQPRSAYRPAPEERRRLWRYAMYNNFNDTGSILLYVQTDNFFIAAFLDPIAVGAYSFYTRINAMVTNLTPMRLLENVVQPLFFAIRPEQAAERLPRYLTLLLNCSLVAQLPLIAYTSVYHHEIVGVLLGGKFLDVSWLLPVVIALATTSNVISGPVTCVAQYQEKASLIMLSQLFGLYQIGAMLVLIPVMGLLGAALATGTFHLFRNLFVWWRVRADARWLNFRAVLGYASSIWGGAVLACFAVKSLLASNPIASLACGAVICVAAVLLYIRSGALCRSDRELLAQLFHGREARLLQRLGVLHRFGHA